ncbi:MAG: DUF4062 domain-containing protein, partial [Anaerolineae bacterium]
DDYKCVRMEDFGARDWVADDFCQAKVAECDLFVGVVGHLYGSCPEASEQSYTEREYEAAIAAGLPRLMFIAPEDFSLPMQLREPDEKWRKQHAFRERVSQARIRDTFTSPNDLARRVVQAIRNWEQEQAAIERRPLAVCAEGVMPLPPQFYFAHPYPLQEHFTGRVREREMLTEWLTRGQRPVLAVIALGGMGKSALTWAWLQRDVLGLPLPGLSQDPSEVAEACRVPEATRPRGVLWWSFYEREARFAAFLEEALSYASGGRVDPAAMASTYERIQALVALLQQRRLLLVLDGFERELRAYASLSAAYQGDAVAEDERGDFRACTDPHATTFLRWVAALPLQSRVLLTSRLFPRELDDLAGCRREDLTALDPDDAVAFFGAQGVRGTRAEIQAACVPYGYHPLALRLLAGTIVRDPSRPGDVTVAARYSPIPGLVPREHHILALAYDALRPPLQKLLSWLAAFRSPVEYEVAAVLSPFESKRELGVAFRELVDRGLLFFDRERGRYDLHPIVRAYAYDQLSDRRSTHTQLRNYFAGLPVVRQVRSIDDLTNLVELYYHSVRSGQYDEAFSLYTNQLREPLYFRIGAHLMCIALLHELFPSLQDLDVPLSKLESQAWLLGDLARCYAQSGQPYQAAPLIEASVSINRKCQNERGLIVALGYLANAQLELGNLAAAEAALRERILLSRVSLESGEEAVSHRQLARVLAYQGQFLNAARELQIAASSFRRIYQEQPLAEEEIRNRELLGKSGHRLCVVWIFMALCAFLAGRAHATLAAARRAYKLALRRGYERDLIESKWLVGAAYRMLGELSEAESRLVEALSGCRKASFVVLEPDILLEFARLQFALARRSLALERERRCQEARDHADEALSIANRCEYRLKQADIHSFLAQLELSIGNIAEARKNAEIAKERAWCDGPPHRYEVAFQEAERLLERIESLKH